MLAMAPAFSATRNAVVCLRRTSPD